MANSLFSSTNWKTTLGGSLSAFGAAHSELNASMEKGADVEESRMMENKNV